MYVCRTIYWSQVKATVRIALKFSLSTLSFVVVLQPRQFKMTTQRLEISIQKYAMPVFEKIYCSRFLSILYYLIGQ